MYSTLPASDRILYTPYRFSLSLPTWVMSMPSIPVGPNRLHSRKRVDGTRVIRSRPFLRAITPTVSQQTIRRLRLDYLVILVYRTTPLWEVVGSGGIEIPSRLPVPRNWKRLER